MQCDWFRLDEILSLILNRNDTDRPELNQFISHTHINQYKAFCGSSRILSKQMHFKSTLLSCAAIATLAFAAPTSKASTLQQRNFLELFPNLIINVDLNDGGAFFSSGYAAEISPAFSTVFSFDVPYDINPTCTLKFGLPTPEGLFHYTVEGSGILTAIPINGVFTNPTSYNIIAPLLGAPYGTFVVSSSGGVGEIGVPCAAGSTFQVVYFV